jgi:hypothetical protein
VKREHGLYLLAAAGGAAVWMFVASASGRREAWDSEVYFSVGMPVVCAIAMIFGFLAPSRPWRWGVAPLVGQFVWMLFEEGPGNLLPLGVIVFGILSVPSIVTASIGAWIATRMAGRGAS